MNGEKMVKWSRKLTDLEKLHHYYQENNTMMTVYNLHLATDKLINESTMSQVLSHWYR